MSLTNSLPRSTGLLGRLDTHARGSLGAPDNTGRLLNLTIGDPDSSRRTAPPWSACSRVGPPWSRHRCQGSALGGFHQKSHHKRYGSGCVHGWRRRDPRRRFCLFRVVCRGGFIRLASTGRRIRDGGLRTRPIRIKAAGPPASCLFVARTCRPSSSSTSIARDKFGAHPSQGSIISSNRIS